MKMSTIFYVFFIIFLLIKILDINNKFNYIRGLFLIMKVIIC